MSTLQQAQAGDNARIILLYGDNNYVSDSPHLFITPLPPVRPAPTEPAKDEASLLRPVIEATAFVGRDVSDSTHFHDTRPPAPASKPASPQAFNAPCCSPTPSPFLAWGKMPDTTEAR